MIRTSKRTTIHHDSLPCAPSKRTRYPSTSSFEHNVTCEPCRTALQKKRDDADAKWKEQHALQAHPAWPCLQAEAAKFGPMSYPRDLAIDGETLAAMESTMPFAWLVYEHGTHLIDPMRFDQDGRRRPPDTALALLRACWPTPSKANGREDTPEGPSGLWYWWDGHALERVHSLRDLRDLTSAAAEEWLPRLRAACLTAKMGLRTIHEDTLFGNNVDTHIVSWVRRNEPTFWRLVANPSARRLHDDPTTR